MACMSRSSSPIKHELESILEQYDDDDNPETLSKLVDQIHDFIAQTKRKRANVDAPMEAEYSLQSSSRTATKATTQQLLNAFEEFDVLLADTLRAADDLYQFHVIKDKIRELFTNLTKQNKLLQNLIIGLEARLSSLEQCDRDNTMDRMGNIGLQL